MNDNMKPPGGMNILGVSGIPANRGPQMHTTGTTNAKMSNVPQTRASNSVLVKNAQPVKTPSPMPGC